MLLGCDVLLYRDLVGFYGIVIGGSLLWREFVRFGMLR